MMFRVEAWFLMEFVICMEVQPEPHYLAIYLSVFFQKLLIELLQVVQLEVVQLMIKLFSLELKNDDPLALASKVRYIMHDIKTTSVEIEIPLIAYVKAL